MREGVVVAGDGRGWQWGGKDDSGWWWQSNWFMTEDGKKIKRGEKKEIKWGFRRVWLSVKKVVSDTLNY